MAARSHPSEGGLRDGRSQSECQVLAEISTLEGKRERRKINKLINTFIFVLANINYMHNFQAREILIHSIFYSWKLLKYV